MDLLKMITELQDERQRLDEAIEALERLSVGTQNQRRVRSLRSRLDDSDGSELPFPDKIDAVPPPRFKKI